MQASIGDSLLGTRLKREQERSMTVGLTATEGSTPTTDESDNTESEGER